MKKFIFRLDPVLRVRRVHEQQARAALALAHAEVERAIASVMARVEAYDTEVRSTGAMNTEQFARMTERLAHAAGAVFVARDALEEARNIEEERRNKWSHARSAVRALERLEERARADHARAIRREEDRLVDDLVTARHRRTQS